MNSIRSTYPQTCRQSLLLVALLCACGLSANAQNPEPAGWFTGDIHVHRSCGGSPVSVTSIRTQMANQNLAIVSLLADMGNGEVQNATTDLPKVNGQNDPASTASRIIHWDAEWHWDATYTQFPHQALGGHIVALGLTNAQQIWQEYTYPIFNWARQQGGIAGFAHLQYLDSGIPQSLNCCIPVEYPVEVALGSCDFISEDVTGSNTAMDAYYRLLNCGFRPSFAGGSDYPCNASIGAVLTYVKVTGSLTYQKWVQGIRAGNTVVSRNGHQEFLDFKVNGTLGPGDEINLPQGGGSVTVSVQWTVASSLSGAVELVQDGNVVASLPSVTASSGSPQTLNATVNFTKSGWLAARRMSNGDHQLHTGAIFVKVNNAPIRNSASDAQFYVQWMDTLLQRTSPGGSWASFFPTQRAAAQARYSAAKALYQQIANEASGPQPLGITTASLPNALVNLPYSATLAASGGATPYTWSIISGSLPSGLSLNASSGAITGTSTVTGTSNFTVRVTDSSNPTQTATRALSIAVTTVPSATTIWPATTVPTVVDTGPDSSVELGVKFRSDISGNITGIRFYKATANTGTHVGNLWSSTGTLLATVTFSGESASGWQQASFPTPAAITSNTTYVASYHANTGHYSENQSYFAAAGADNPPLHALSSGASGGNGLYRYGSTSAFPNSTWMDANYWVDVVFQTSAPQPDTTPPTITSVSPASGATGVSTGATVTVTFNEPMDNSTINSSTIQLRDSASALVQATVTYNASTRVATLTPQSVLAPQASYTATVVGGSAGVKDVAGNPLAANFVWSFTTGGSLPDTTPPTVTSVVPANGATGVSASTTVRATFNEAMQSSTINSLTFVLQNSSGTTLSATVTYDSASRTATLTPSGPLALATTHTATLKGGAGGVADAAGNPMASDFVWSFTTAVPDTTPPTILSVTPAPSATGVSNSTAITVRFSEAMNPATINTNTIVLLDPVGNPVPGTVSYNGTTFTGVLTPNSSLGSLQTYTAGVDGGAAGVKDAAGNPLASDFIWIFTTTTQVTYSIWDNSAVPSVVADSDTAAVELGVKFRSSVAGSVLGVRFYKSTANTGTHVGNLWTSTGTRLATVTFVNETASGWQYQAFPTPVAINSNTVYVVSYRAPVGRYSADTGYFAGSGFDKLALHALADGESGGNGVYRYGTTSAFPNSTWASSHYWVDLVFQPK